MYIKVKRGGQQILLKEADEAEKKNKREKEEHPRRDSATLADHDVHLYTPVARV